MKDRTRMVVRVSLGLILALGATVAIGAEMTDVVDPAAVPALAQAAGNGVEEVIAKTIPDFLTKALPFMIGLMILFRGLSEALLAVAHRLGGDDTRKVARVLAQVAGFIGTVVAYFGAGTPAQVATAKAAKIAAKAGGHVGNG